MPIRRVLLAEEVMDDCPNVFRSVACIPLAYLEDFDDAFVGRFGGRTHRKSQAIAVLEVDPAHLRSKRSGETVSKGPIRAVVLGEDRAWVGAQLCVSRRSAPGAALTKSPLLAGAASCAP